MTDHRQFIRDVVANRQPLKIDIQDTEGKCLGYFAPTTVAVLDQPDTIQKLTDWRNREMRFFMTSFTATPERTRRWLADGVLADDRRLLFLMYVGERLVGHCGFRDLTEESVELDNLIRGESGGHPRLVYFAVCALIRWLFETFPIDCAYGYALADNVMVLNLHRAVGLRQTDRLPLRRVEDGGEVTFQRGAVGETSPDGRYCQKVEMTRADFDAYQLVG